MSWPTMSDYQEAIQSPQICFADHDLRRGIPALNSLGLPRPITGGFASVYEITSNGQRWAVRCFLRDFKDQADRYRLIGGHLSRVSLPYMIPFDFQPQGILIQGHRFPILKMGWVQGKPLNSFVESVRHTPTTLASLAQRWTAMVADLRNREVAHGDLQHGNVIVTSAGELKLIDYDGMWVPALSGRGSHETGHPSYQNPKRSATDFHRDIDSFAATVILVSILATAKAPVLWDDFSNGDNMLFRRDDFLDPQSSRVFSSILALGDSTITPLANRLIRDCGFEPQLVNTRAVPTGLAGGVSWLSDHVSGMPHVRIAEAISDFRMRLAWKRPGVLQVRRVRTEPVYVTKTRYRTEPVYVTKVRYRTEPIMEQRTKVVDQQVPATTSSIAMAIRSFLGLPLKVSVQRQETYQIQVGTRQVPEEYTEQSGTRSVPDGTFREQTGTRDVIDTIDQPQSGHTFPVRAVALTRNGEQVVSGDEGGIVIVWTTKDGHRVRTLACVGAAITGVAPLGDNQFAVSGGKSIEIWTTSGGHLRTFKNKRNSFVNGIATSPDGRYVAGALGVMEIHVWDTQSGVQAARLKIHRRKVLCAAYGSTNNLLVSGSEDMSVKVWDVKQERCRHTLYGHTAPVGCVSVSPNDKLAASGDMDGYLNLWDLGYGGSIMKILAHSQQVTSVAFSPDSRVVVTTGDEGRVRWWDVRTGKSLSEQNLQQKSVAGMAINSRCTRVAICSSSGISLFERGVEAKP